MSFSPDSKQIAGNDSNIIKIWDAKTGHCQSKMTVGASHDKVLSISFSPKDNVIAAGCNNGNIYLVDAVAGEVKSTFTGHTRYDLLSLALLAFKLVLFAH